MDIYREQAGMIKLQGNKLVDATSIGYVLLPPDDETSSPTRHSESFLILFQLPHPCCTNIVGGESAFFWNAPMSAAMLGERWP